MSAPIPYLGSKISLISKSEIRYEGILYTIDAQESIIALAKVQSFGTEDRQTNMPVPAREETYEYIIFRGTDIKKIEVCNDSSKQPGILHNDPAIVEHSAPTSLQAAPYSRSSLGPVGGSVGGMGGNVPPYNNVYGQSIIQQGIPGTVGFPMGGARSSDLSGNGTAVGGGGPGSSSTSSNTPLEPASSITTNAASQVPIGVPPARQQRPQQQATDVLSGSRSSTPTARKSPISDASVQASPGMNREDHKKSPKQPEKQRENKEYQQQSNRRPNRAGPRQYSQAVGQERSNSGSGSSVGGERGNSGNYQQYQGYPGQGNREGGGGGGGGNGFQGYRGRSRASRRQSQSRRGGQGFNQNRERQIQDQQLFEKEFDFEKANEDFEELMTKLSKTKITENGDAKKDDSGHETSSAGEPSTEPVDDECSTYYDKAKSFFDTISCEAVERSKGKSQRPDWRQERKINVETFGVSSTRRGYYPRGRGGYRGGGGGYYRNYQGYYNYNYNNYRGGSGGGYRGRGGNRGGNNQQQRSNESSTSYNNYASAIRSSPSKQQQ